MSTLTRHLAAFPRHLRAGARMLVVLTLVCGLAYPLLVTLAGQAMPGRSGGSLLRDDRGAVVGSALIGQEFTGPQWFQPRPAVGDYAGDVSGGSNLGMSAAEQRKAVEERRAAVRAANPDAAGEVPPDALTASFSGLDPHISPEYAAFQAPRVAQARGLSRQRVEELIAAHTQGRLLGFIGEPRVNVLELNLSLAQAGGSGPSGSATRG